MKGIRNNAFDIEMQNLLTCFVIGIDTKSMTLDAMRIAYNAEISRINLKIRKVPLVELCKWHSYKEDVNRKYNAFRDTVESF